MSKWFKLAALITVTVVAATATSVASAKSQRSSKSSITLWIMPNSANPVADMDKILKPFTNSASNPNVKVVNVDWGSAFGRIQAEAITYSGAVDVTQVGTTWNPYMASLNGFSNLSSKISQVGGKAAFPKGSYNTVLCLGKPGVWGLPWFIEARMLYYRTDVLKAAKTTAGVAFKTQASYKAYLVKVKNLKNNKFGPGGSKIAPLGMPGRNTWDVPHNFAPLMWGNGGDWLNAANTASTINKKPVVDTAMYLGGMISTGLIDKTSIQGNAATVESQFKNGELAVWAGGPWVVASAKNSPKGWNATALSHWANAKYPKGSKGSWTFLGGSNLMIYKKSPSTTANWNLVKFMMQCDTQTKMLNLIGMLPSRIACQSSALSVYPKYKPWRDYAVAAGKSYPAISYWGDMETLIVAHLSNV